MSALIGSRTAVVGGPGDVHAEPKNDLGAIAQGSNGEEYIYLKGVASNAPGRLVTYLPSTFTSVLANTTHRGPIVVSTSTANGTSYGWNVLRGSVAPGAVETHTANVAPLFLTTTAGQANVTPADHTLIIGAYATANATANVGAIHVDRAFAPGVGINVS